MGWDIFIGLLLVAPAFVLAMIIRGYWCSWKRSLRKLRSGFLFRKHDRAFWKIISKHLGHPWPDADEIEDFYK